jgi:glutamine amidotransferase
MTVWIVDTGLGNVAALQNMLTWIGIPSARLTSPETVDERGKFLLPGVGSFDEGVRRLRSSGWFGFLKDCPPSTRILGICLGMQLLGLASEEGDESGLGRIDVNFKRFQDVPQVPHMGWNDVTWGLGTPFYGGTADRMYFTHSFAGEATEADQVVGTTLYGTDFHSACSKQNTLGVQFHPEKSHSFGKTFLQTWYSLPC